MDLPHYLNTRNCLQVKTFQTSPQLDNYQITLQVHSKFGNYTWKKKKNESYIREEKEQKMDLPHCFCITFAQTNLKRTEQSITSKKEQNSPFFLVDFLKKKDSQYEKTYDWDLSWPNLR